MMGLKIPLITKKKTFFKIMIFKNQLSDKMIDKCLTQQNFN